MIDPFTIKPLDASTILASARATGGQIITVEDHYKEGGLISVLVLECPTVRFYSHVPKSFKRTILKHLICYCFAPVMRYCLLCVG